MLSLQHCSLYGAFRNHVLLQAQSHMLKPWEQRWAMPTMWLCRPLAHSTELGGLLSTLVVTVHQVRLAQASDGLQPSETLCSDA